MEVEDRKKVIKSSLTNSFVEDYDAYKKTIEFINKDLEKSKIGFQYEYDEFCVEFLNQTLVNIEDIRNGDFVLDAFGNPKEVIDLLQYTIEEDIIELIFENNNNSSNSLMIKMIES